MKEEINLIINSQRRHDDFFLSVIERFLIGSWNTVNSVTLIEAVTFQFSVHVPNYNKQITRECPYGLLKTHSRLHSHFNMMQFVRNVETLEALEKYTNRVVKNVNRDEKKTDIQSLRLANQVSCIKNSVLNTSSKASISLFLK